MIVSLKDQLLKSPPKNGKFYLVAIDGRGGSGKTMLAKYLSKLLPDFIFINGDDYFEPTPNTVAWGNFNDERFAQDVVEPLKKGQKTLAYKPYDWHSQPHVKERTINVDKGICIERCYSFAFDLGWDLKIWVETPSDITFKRGQERDKMPVDRADKAWKEVWQPREDKYIEQTNPQESANIVIDGTHPFTEQISI